MDSIVFEEDIWTESSIILIMSELLHRYIIDTSKSHKHLSTSLKIGNHLPYSFVPYQDTFAIIVPRNIETEEDNSFDTSHVYDYRNEELLIRSSTLQTFIERAKFYELTGIDKATFVSGFEMTHIEENLFHCYIADDRQDIKLREIPAKVRKTENLVIINLATLYFRQQNHSIQMAYYPLSFFGTSDFKEKFLKDYQECNEYIASHYQGLHSQYSGKLSSSLGHYILSTSESASLSEKHLTAALEIIRDRYHFFPLDRVSTPW